MKSRVSRHFQRGTAMLEFVVAIPYLLFLFCGFVDYTRYMIIRDEMLIIAQKTAHLAASNSGLTVKAYKAQSSHQSTDALTQFAQAQKGALIDPKKISLNITFYDIDQTVDNTTCLTVPQSCLVKITMRYSPFKCWFPFYPQPSSDIVTNTEFPIF